MYSQNDEEQHILSMFAGHVGRFIDIGANDGTTGSNTARLIELGWSGVMVEPSAQAFVKLKERYWQNPTVILVNAAIGNKWELVHLWESLQAQHSPYSTTQERNRKKWQNLANFPTNPQFITTIPISELFKLVQTPVDFVNIDAEGESMGIFKEWPMCGEFAPKLFCIEHDGDDSLCSSIAKEYGYRMIATNAENILLWNNSPGR